MHLARSRRWNTHIIHPLFVYWTLQLAQHHLWFETKHNNNSYSGSNEYACFVILIHVRTTHAFQRCTHTQTWILPQRNDIKNIFDCFRFDCELRIERFRAGNVEQSVASVWAHWSCAEKYIISSNWKMKNNSINIISLFNLCCKSYLSVKLRSFCSLQSSKSTECWENRVRSNIVIHARWESV